MMGRQINFYLMKEDIIEIDEYITKSGMIILPNFTQTESFEPIKSLIDNKYFPGKYLSLPSLTQQIKKRYVDTQNYFVIDVLQSPVIEISPGYQEENLKRRGRIYYTKDTTGSSSVTKSESFLQMADDFFKWFRKHFKNIKLNGYENLLISERTGEWLEASEQRKLADFPDAIKNAEKKKLVA
jgi:hypothetical protein